MVARAVAGLELEDAEDGAVVERRAALAQPSSALPVLSIGNPWLVQTTQAVAPGRAERRFCDTSSI
jgi:hypothetical protein